MVLFIKMLKEELRTNKKLKPEQIKAIEKEIKATKNATKTTREFGAKMKDAGKGLIKSIGKMALDTAMAIPRTIMNFMDATSGVKDFHFCHKRIRRHGPTPHAHAGQEHRLQRQHVQDTVTAGCGFWQVGG